MSGAVPVRLEVEVRVHLDASSLAAIEAMIGRVIGAIVRASAPAPAPQAAPAILAPATAQVAPATIPVSAPFVAPAATRGMAVKPVVPIRTAPKRRAPAPGLGERTEAAMREANAPRRADNAITLVSRRGHVWSDARKGLLMALWGQDIPTSEIFARINALDGATILDPGHLSIQAAKLNVSRHPNRRTRHAANRD